MPKTIDAVSTYFAALIDRSTKTQDEIAKEAGFHSPNTISMIKTGRTKLPIARIPALAKALDSDPRELLALALQTYEPELYRVYSTISPEMLISVKEYELLKAVRKVAGVRMLT